MDGPAGALPVGPLCLPPSTKNKHLDRLDFANCVWASKRVNTRKADHLPHELGLKLSSVPRVPRELPVTLLIRNAFEIEDWKRFLG